MRTVLALLAGLVGLALGAVQLGSDAIFARAGEPASLPAHLHVRLGLTIYRTLARIAPAPYVESMLARAELDRGNLAQAQVYARRLPDSAKRDDVLGQIAQARGDERAARQYFIRAGDIEAIDRAVDALAPAHPAAAYELELRLTQRLASSGTHPDAVAEGYWRMGELAWQESKRQLGMQDYVQAVTISPLSEKYLLSAGFGAYELHADAQAQSYFQRVIGVNPASADAYAGAGMVALRDGDRARAEQYADRARAIDPHAHAMLTLEKQLHP